MVVALYKTLTGGEWITDSISSIYHHVDYLVFVHSDTAWGGQKELNDCKGHIARYKVKNNKEGKIHELNGRFISQNEQYSAGLHFIKEWFNGAYILVIDSDEIWDEENLLRLKKRVSENPNYASYSCRMKTYVKSPFYRIKPIEPCAPVVILDSKKVDKPLGVRWNGVKPNLCFQDVFMHHFTYVRDNEEKIRRKLAYVETGDGVKYRKDWFDKFWHRIPNVRDFHATIGHERCWQGVEKVTIDELPKAIRTNKVVRKWINI